MYHYTTLGPERFQEFCQALIVSSFPNAQCLPIGQPDGGRDAFVIRHALARNKKLAGNKEIVVFQVKYSRSGGDDRSEREFLKSIIQKEKPKINVLKQNGLSRYYLMTNIPGTAHPDVGSIDRINDYLTNALDVESYCWWRDDLDRRLDANSSIKWSYPEVLKATDLLGALISGMLGEDEERRRAAIRAYTTAQYVDDEELKFKQVELRSTMTNLFVDLPMTVNREINVHHRLSLPGLIEMDRFPSSTSQDHVDPLETEYERRCFDAASAAPRWPSPSLIAASA